MTHLATPVVLFIYKRSETSLRVLHRISQVNPSKLFLIADGPKGENEKKECLKTRKLIEDKIDWECKLTKIYANENLGLARRISTGLDKVFDHEDSAIILEDDTLPDSSFFQFCEELLDLYANDHRVGHISGCNFHPEIFSTNHSYLCSSIINVWGWATWKRSWNNFDLNMVSWKNVDKDMLLNKWCISKQHKRGMRKMFDLHCENKDPWAWSYQWIYACWNSNALSIIPRENLVSNLGIGPDATNTCSTINLDEFPKITKSIKFPLFHPDINRNNIFEKRYIQANQTPYLRRFKNFIKSWL